MRKRWSISGQPNSLQSPLSSAWQMTRLNFSMHIRKIYGEMESPCLIPSLGLNQSSCSPFKTIENLLVSMQLMIFRLQSWLRPVSRRVSRINFQDSLSYAFSKSIFTTIYPLVPFFFCIECNISWYIRMLSVICLPGTKLPDDIRHYFFKPICHGLSKNFIAHIT